MTKFKKGDRVEIRATDDCPVERGTVCGDEENGCVIIQLDVLYYDDFDDGIREVPVVCDKGLPTMRLLDPSEDDYDEKDYLGG